MPTVASRLLLLLLASAGLWGQAPPEIRTVVNLASGEERLSPGVLANIFGDNFLQEPGTAPLSVQQAGTVTTSVLINGIDGFVVNATPTEVEVQLPVDVAPGPGFVNVNRGPARSARFRITLSAFAPAIFTTAGSIASFGNLDGVISQAAPVDPGATIWVEVTGLGATTPHVPTGVPAPSSPLATTNFMPAVTVDGIEAAVVDSFLEPGQVGRYRVVFVVPDQLRAGTLPLVVSIGGVDSNTALLPVSDQGRPSIGSVVNAASFADTGAAAPGTLLTIFGENFGTGDNLSLFPNTTFEDLSVTANAASVPLSAVVASAGQINFVLSNELPEFGELLIRLHRPSVESEAASLQLTPASPGVFRIPDPSGLVANNAAALLAGTAWIAGPRSLGEALLIPTDCESLGVNPASICASPAKPGGIVLIFVTGLGRATIGGDPAEPLLPTGQPAPASGDPLYVTVNEPTVFIAGMEAEVLFSGLSPGFAGLYQLNVRIPLGVQPGDEVIVEIVSANGLRDSSTIAISPL